MKSTLASGIITLIIGFSLGYVVATKNVEPAPIPVGMHQMPDGTMMNNGGMSMEDMMRDMNRALEGKTGDEFDQAFLAEMIVHHQGAVGMAQAALTNAKHQEIKDLAAEIIRAQEKEIAQMQEWQKNWYSN